MSRARAIASRLGLVFLGLLVGALFVEGLARVALPEPADYQAAIRAFAAVAVVSDPVLGHRIRPGAQVEARGVRYSFSKIGTRGPEPMDPPPALRILALGDSVTMGWGVRDRESWPAQLQNILRSRGLDAEVINAGVLGYDTAQELGRLEELLPALKPQVILLGYYPNDPEEARDSWAIDGSRWSAAWRLFAPKIQGLLVGMGLRDTATEHHLRLHVPGSDGWARVRQGIGRFAEICRQAMVACAFLSLPELSGLPYALDEIDARLSKEVTAQRLPFLALSIALAGTDPTRLWVAPDDAHPNAFAHRRYAEAIAAWLPQAGLLGGGGPQDEHGAGRQANDPLGD